RVKAVLPSDGEGYAVKSGAQGNNTGINSSPVHDEEQRRASATAAEPRERPNRWLTRRGGLRRISRSCRSFCGRASALRRQHNITAALLNISDRDPKARSKRPRDRE